MHLASAERPPQTDAEGTLNALDPLELETLVLNLDMATRIHTRAHFFGWTQGLVQGMVKHEVLVCALRGAESHALRADSFSVAADPGALGELLLRDGSAAQLIKAWEERRFRPLLCDASGTDSPVADGAFARELERLGATRLLAHGTHDADGKLASLFLFGCAPGTVGPRQAYLAQLAVPSLHAAWVRTLTNGRTKGIEGLRPVVASNITAREQEILKWVYVGKSNIEIGTILGISPLTVKNHVQKILRKLDVLNRTQAVGKALALRILNP